MVDPLAGWGGCPADFFQVPQVLVATCRKLKNNGRSAKDDDVGWHWDADYEARECGDVQHPLLGTVTYLEAGGSVAPTAVLEDCFETELLAGKGAMVARAHLSLPVPGKHICFDGRLLHAAPAQLREIFGSAKEVQCGKSRRRKPSRTTLLVNIWQGHRPKDPRPLGQAVATKLAPAVNTSSFSLGSGDPVEPLELRVGRGTRAREISWQFGEDDLMSVLLPIPETADIKADSIALRFVDGRCGCVG